MFFVKTPTLIQTVFSSAHWCIKNSSSIYLSFDDGPNPNSTPEILNLLKQYNIRASFFCLGKNIDKYPQLINDIRNNGHSLGYHGYEHLSGWTTSDERYFNNAQHQSYNTTLFRPPFGRIKWQQYKQLCKDKKVIMWDIMPGDFKANFSAEKCLGNITKNVTQGSIIVLHDTPLALSKLKIIIPKLKQFIDKNHLKFDRIQSSQL